MQHVILGAGPAGVRAAETIREYDQQSQIMLLSDEPEPPYSRMALPYYLVGKIDEVGTYLSADPAHYENLGIELINDRVDNIDTENQELIFSNNHFLGYDRLLIATGSSPFIPPIPGIQHARVQPCWTLEHARNIAKLAIDGARVLLMGAGFIGCIVMEALAARGCKLSIVEMGDRMVPRMMNERAGGTIKAWCEAKNVKVLTSTRVMAVEPINGGDSLIVNMSNGESIEVDLLISATGVKPNIDFIQDSDIEIDQGILVNEYMQTNIPGIYAAGDVAQGRDFSTGGKFVQAIQPTAVEHAKVAAMNMVGKTMVNTGTLAMNVLETLGLVSYSFGLWMGVDGGEYSELYDPDGFRYLNLQFDGDRLVGATTIGLMQHVGIIRGLIQGRIPLGAQKEVLLNDPIRVTDVYVGGSRFILG